MTDILQWVGTVVLLLVTLSGCLDDNKTVSVDSSLEETISVPIPKIDVGVPATNLPPYFIHQEKGIELDIVRDAFQQGGYQVKFHFIRSRKEKFYDPKYSLDCISTVTKKAKRPGFYSDDVISYQDIVIYLADQKFNIDKIEDLANKSIGTFHDAKEHLGLAKVVAKNQFYHEHSGKASQIVLFYRHRVDILIMDRYFFAHFRKRVASLVDITQKLVVKDHLFTERPYKVLCKKEKVRDDFNLGLAKLRAEGRYEEIIKQYVEEPVKRKNPISLGGN